MEENSDIYRWPKYTLRWLGTQSVFVLGMALAFALIAGGIDQFAFGRYKEGLLQGGYYNMLSQSILYCFAVNAITSLSLMLIEVAFRKSINYLQYVLIGMALTLFYLLLLSLTEHLSFGLSYTIVSVMTIGLIAAYIKGITQKFKAVSLSVVILAVEYGLLFILVNLGALALLVGSLCLFVLIALAMYFTLKLKVENEELVIK